MSGRGQADHDENELIIGEVRVGAHLKSGARWGKIGAVAAVVAAVASVATLIVTLLRN